MRAALSRVYLFALALLLPALALVVPMPAQPMIFGVLSNAAHAPVFGAFAIVLVHLARYYARWPARFDYHVVFLLTVIAGGAIELIQLAYGRDAELADIGTDALGAIGGLAIIAWFHSRHRRLAAFLLVSASMAIFWPVVEAALAYRERFSQVPSILEITSRFDWYFISTSGAHVSTTLLPGPWRCEGDPESVRMQFIRGRWPVLAIVEPLPDWRGYISLKVDLTNPDPQRLRLTLRVHDRVHDNQASDRFNRPFTLAGGERTVLVIPISEIARAPVDRPMDLSRIAGVMLFAEVDPRFADREIYVTRIWLE